MANKYAHVKPLNRMGTTTIVHAVKDDHETLCGWIYMSDQMHNGNLVPFAASTTEKLSCRKCAGAMRWQIKAILTNMSSDQVEKLLASLPA